MTKTAHKKKTLHQLLALLLAIAATVSLLVIPAEAATVYGGDQIIPDGEYGLLCHDNTSKCVNIGFATKTQDKKGVVIIDTWNGEQNETIIAQNRGGGYVTLSPKHAPDLCINALLGNKTPGDGLALHHYTAGDACSLWLPIINSDGSVSFKNKYTQLCMDVTNANYTSGNQVISWTPNGYLAAQAFYLKLAAAPSGSVVLANGEYAILLHNDKTKCLNIQFATKTQDKMGVVVVDNWSRESNEIFIITNRGSGRVTISPKHAPNLCLNALLANPKPKDGIALHAYTEGDMASLWLPIKNADGSISFRSCATGYMLDIYNANYSIGNKAISWHSNGNQASQSYWLNSVSGPEPAPAQQQISAKLSQMMNGTYGSGVYKVNTVYRGPYYTEQCKGFAKSVFQNLFGYNIGSTKASPNNYQINIDTSKTKLVGTLASLSSRSDATLKSLLAQARPGDFLQVRRSHGGSHSMIVLSTSSSGITVYECNVDGANGIRTATYTWASFRSVNAAVGLYTAKDYSLHC